MAQVVPESADHLSQHKTEAIERGELERGSASSGSGSEKAELGMTDDEFERDDEEWALNDDELLPGADSKFDVVIGATTTTTTTTNQVDDTQAHKKDLQVVVVPKIKRAAYVETSLDNLSYSSSNNSISSSNKESDHNSPDESNDNYAKGIISSIIFIWGLIVLYLRDYMSRFH